MDSLLTKNPELTFKVNGVDVDSFNVKRIRFLEATDHWLGVPEGSSFNSSAGFEFHTNTARIEPHLEAIPKMTPFALSVVSDTTSHIVVCTKSEDNILYLLDGFNLAILKPDNYKTLSERINHYFSHESEIKSYFKKGISYWQVIENKYPNDYRYTDPETCVP